MGGNFDWVSYNGQTRRSELEDTGPGDLVSIQWSLWK